MWKCICGAVFSYPRTVTDFHCEHFGYRANVSINVCPECGSEEIELMKKCPLCGEYHDGEDDYCENCEDVIREHVDSAIKDIQVYGFDRDDIIDAIREYY